MEKKWNPNGWYYDEEKRKWIAPDYKYVQDGKFTPKYQAEHGAKSPTGWTYNRDTMKWDPPKQLIEESKRKWRWDEEKRIWIDQEKEARIKRYREYRKAQGKEPTYEEWKEAKLEAERKKNQDQSAPAPGQNEPENCKE